MTESQLKHVNQDLYLQKFKKKTFYKGTGNKQKDKLQKVILKKLNIIINKRMFKKFFFKK